MEEMEYIKIPLHGKNGEGKFTLVDGDYDGEYFSQYRWYLLPNGYAGRAMIELPAKDRKGYIYLHHEVAGKFYKDSGMVVDHINRNKLDNRSVNIRITNYRGNALNRAPSVRKTNGPYRGVTEWRKTTADGRKIYQARFRGEYLGQSTDPIMLAKRYDEKAREYFGESAITNF